MNYLKAAFWDYPQFTDIENLKKNILESKGSKVYLWILKRFLEHGRVIDTLNFFSCEEISNQLPKLNLQPYTYKKWRRITEVYGKS